jgi:mRNA interferase RelE/StbE
MRRRVAIQWTDSAKKGLGRLPKKVRKGLLNKADELLHADPTSAHKPLVGPLQGYFRITYGRYRAIYTVREETKSNGEVVLQVTILFVAAGIRKQGDKQDIYRLAERLKRLGLLDPAT